MKKLNTYFEAIYFINLAYRTDRYKNFIEQTLHFNHANIIRFEGIVGKDIAPNEWPGTPGSFGCRASHISVLQNAKQKGYQRFIVFEDDVIVKKSFEKKAFKIIDQLGEDWDMIYLYVENHFLKPIKYSNNVIRLQNTLGLVGVMYNARNIDIIISKLENDFRWVDSCMADLHLELKVYGPKKSIVSHSKGYSDNEGRVLHYQRFDPMNLIKKIYRRFRSMLKNE